MVARSAAKAVSLHVDVEDGSVVGNVNTAGGGGPPPVSANYLLRC